MDAQEDARSLAEFYPDAEKRSQVHYFFAHRFLPELVHGNPFNFMYDSIDPARFVRIRWNIMEHVTGLQPRTYPPILRVLTDLDAWRQTVAGHPGVFIEMPKPEGYTRAHFVAVVLLVDAEEFEQASQKLNSFIRQQGPEPAKELMEPLIKARARVFTLERPTSEEEAAAGFGLFCEWAQHEKGMSHLNSGASILTTRAAFADAVAQSLARA